jgi:hypothetical protein
VTGVVDTEGQQTGAAAARGYPLTLWLLVVVWVCNVVDLVLTRVALSTSRAVEGNAAMAVLFRQGDRVAAGGKLVVVTLGVVLLWRLRRRGLARAAAAGLAVVLVAVVTYEVLWLL